MSNRIKWLAPAIGMILLAGFPVTGFSQQLLTKSEAVRMTLEKNYGIKVAKNNVRTAENNTSKGNTGYLPTVNASAATNGSLGGSNQQFNNGMEASVSNAFSWGANAALQANYTIFDKTREYNLEQLKEVLTLTDLQLRQTMELSLIQLFSNYFEVARLTENLSVLAETLEVSKSRLERVRYQFEYGQGVRLDVLNAEVDVQRDSINYLNARQLLANAKRNLNVIMGTEIGNAFNVDTTVAYIENLQPDQLIQETMRNNVDLMLADKNLSISELNMKVIDAGRKPVVGANAAYNYSFQDNPAGAFITSSNSRGLAFGLTANWNIFDGGLRKVREQNTRISIESQFIQKEQLEQELERDLMNAWESYQNALFILRAEENNLATNRLNLERTEEQFKIGQVTSVEFRQAQLNLLNAATSYSAAKYDAKFIELQLLQLNGSLLNVEF